MVNSASEMTATSKLNQQKIAKANCARIVEQSDVK